MKIQADAITIANATRIVAAGVASIRGGDLTVDLGAVRRCDTSAVACLLAWQRCAQAAGGRLQVQGMPPDLLSLATLYGVQALVAPAP